MVFVGKTHLNFPNASSQPLTFSTFCSASPVYVRVKKLKIFLACAYAFEYNKSRIGFHGRDPRKYLSYA